MTIEFKTYARAIDARSFIEARPELAAIPYQIDMVDGKAMPVFAPSNTAQDKVLADAVEAMPERKRAPFKTVANSVGAPDPVEPNPAKKPATKKAKEMPAPEAKSMAEKAMLAELTIKGWSGRAQDKEANVFVAQSYQANAKWTKVTKALVNTEALKAVKKAEAAARAVHKRFTLPWNEDKQRILPAKAFHDYTKEVGQARDAHEKAVDDFVGVYDSLIEEARKELGGMFNAEDYPTAAEIQAKFTFDSELTTLDVTGDFRVAMSDAEMKRLQDQITKRTEARLAGAMTDVYQRLHEVVAHMAQRLNEYQPATEDAPVQNPFRDATLRNVADIVDLMPKLNITDDPDLDALAAQVRETLLSADAKTLRTDSDKRQAVAQAAESIAGAMAGMM